MPTKENCRHDVERSLSIAVSIFRRYIDENWRPSLVEFTHPRPASIYRHIEQFGEEIHFEQATNKLVFESNLLDTSITDADPAVLRVLKTQTEKAFKTLQRQDTLIGNLRYLIIQLLDSDKCDSENIARQLNLSRRSLTRYLADKETGFREIKQDVIQELAKSALTQTDASISQIALQLGFSETSAFDRTFKRLTRYTPRQYRQNSRLKS